MGLVVGGFLALALFSLAPLGIAVATFAVAGLGLGVYKGGGDVLNDIRADYGSLGAAQKIYKLDVKAGKYISALSSGTAKPSFDEATKKKEAVLAAMAPVPTDKATATQRAPLNPL